MLQEIGKQSVKFDKAPRVAGSASVVGKKESKGPLGGAFDVVCTDDKFGENNWEASESEMQRVALETALNKSGIEQSKIRFLFGGDLLGQLIATSFGLEEFQIPLIGLYGACSTCGESILMASMAIAGGFAGCTAAITSSHFASAEKQFRFPLAYGNQRPLSASWTVTGSGAFILEQEETAIDTSHVKVCGGTIGKILDYGVKDSMNMGACMAPAAADTIYQHLQDFSRCPEDYDRIITGDLGYVGQTILFELLRQKGVTIENVHMDCGIEIYDRNTQDTHSGGSGCGCSAVTLSAYILPKLRTGEWKRVLFVPTGALLSPVSFNEGKSVPGIAHGVVFEHC